MRLRLLCPVLALLSLALILGSCGDGAAKPAGGVTRYPVGAVLEKSGTMENWGDSSQKGLELASEELNGKDGIAFDLFVEDNKSTPEQSANAFISLCNVKNVLVVIGSVASSNTRAMKEQANKLKVPLITHASTNVQLTKETEWLFRVCWNDAFQGAVCANFAHDQLKAKKAVIVTDSGQDYSRGLSQNFRETYTKSGGVVVDELTYQSGDKVFTSQVEKLKSLDVDCVFASGYAAEVAMMLKAAREAGFSKPFLGGDGLDDQQFFSIAGPAAGTGVYLCNHAHNDDPDPRVQAFVKAYKAKYGAVPPNAMAFLAYDALYAVQDSIKRAAQKGTVTRETLRDAIATIKDLPLVTGTITIGPDHEVRKRAVVVECQADGTLKFVAEIKP